MKSFKLLLVILAAIFALAACSDDDVNTTTTASTGQNIAGTYSLGCTASGGGSFNATLSISSSVATITVPLYLTVADCSGTADYQENETATLTFVDAVTLASGEVVSRTSITDTAETVIPNTDTGTASLNGSMSWGISDWATGVSRSVLGVDESTGDPTSTIDLDIIYLNDTVTPNTLQFGDDSTGATTDTDGYYNTLDSSMILTRQ